MPQTFNVGARSLFVTLTAWAFIALAALAVVWAVLQGTALLSLMPPASESSSVWMGWVREGLPWLLRGGVLLSLATLACAVGLLLRLDWARRAFIGLLVLTLVAQLPGLWLQQQVVQALLSQAPTPSGLAPQVMHLLDGFITATRSMAALMTLVACALLGWIIRRLMSPAVRQEFA